jgi:hypothetical protein
LDGFIPYPSRIELLTNLQVINIRITNSRNGQHNNGLGKIVLGVTGIGKSYLLQNLAIHVGLSRPDLFVVYVSCQSISMNLLDSLVSIAKQRSILAWNQFQSLADFIINLKIIGLTTLLVVDDLQYMYPQPNSSMSDDTIRSKITFMMDLCLLDTGGWSLVFAAGSSGTLVDMARYKIGTDERLGDYPSLKNMSSMTLFPITEKKDFKNAVVKLKTQIIKENEMNDFYINTGGVIRMMITNDRVSLPDNILDRTTMLQVLLHLYDINERQLKNDPFEKISMTQRDLMEYCSQYEEDFKAQTLKLWCDEAYLLLTTNSTYTYLTGETLFKLYEISPLEHISIAEKASFHNPATLLEKILTEGMIVRRHWTCDKIMLPNLEMSTLTKEFVMRNCKKFFKPIMMNIEKLGFDSICWDIKYETEEIEFEWYLFKFGDVNQYISDHKEELTI